MPLAHRGDAVAICGKDQSPWRPTAKTSRPWRVASPRRNSAIGRRPQALRQRHALVATPADARARDPSRRRRLRDRSLRPEVAPLRLRGRAERRAALQRWALAPADRRAAVGEQGQFRQREASKWPSQRRHAALQLLPEGDVVRAGAAARRRPLRAGSADEVLFVPAAECRAVGVRATGGTFRGQARQATRSRRRRDYGGAATWIVREVAATPRPRRGSAATRGVAAPPQPWRGRDANRGRGDTGRDVWRGRDADRPRRRAEGPACAGADVW